MDRSVRELTVGQLDVVSGGSAASLLLANWISMLQSADAMLKAAADAQRQRNDRMAQLHNLATKIFDMS